MTIHPHFAALIAGGLKTIEGRTWERPHRGPLAIHASQGWGRGGFREVQRYLLSDDCPPGLWNALLKLRGNDGQPLVEGPERAPRRRFRLHTAPHEGNVNADAFVRAHIVAVAQVDDIVAPADLPPDVYDREAPLCDFSWATHAWVLRDVQPIYPVPCTGGQQLWEVPQHVVREIGDELQAVRAKGAQR